ncbi:tetratricopeptide repeat protein [Patescibacteria group bacterium]
MIEILKKLIPLDSISSRILVALLFLLPIFFIPFSGVTPEMAKYALFTIGTIIALFLWLVSRLREGKIVIPKATIFLGVLAVVVVTFISALFSPAVKVSLLGSGAEMSPFIVIFTAFLLMFLSSIYFQSIKKVFNVYGLLIISFLIVALFQIVRIIFGPETLSFGGMFASPTSNLVGKWNDLSLFSGLIAIILVVTLQIFPLKRVQKISLYVLLALSVLLLALTNFSVTWILVGLFSLSVFIYAISFSGRGEGSERSLPVVPILVALISLLFILAPAVGNYFAGLSNVQNVEVRPSWSATANIAKEVITTDPVLGSGPNRFVNQWLSFKPAEINQTLFWNTDFNFGIGMVPTFAITAGMLGVIAWILFLVLFLILGAKAIWSLRENISENYLVVSSFFAALYLWVVSFFYVPNITGFALTFLFTGIFIATLARTGVIKNYSVSFLNDPRVGFASVLAMVLLIIATVSTGYFFAGRYVATQSFANGVTAFNSGDVEKARTNIRRAAEIGNTDEYYRALSEIQIQRIIEVVSQGDTVSQDTIRAQFQTALGDAIAGAQEAVKIDETDYLNWLTLGKVYESVVPLGIEGAYENAISSYERSVSLNPQSPALLLSIARLELANQDVEAAREYIDKAIELKQNYTEAIFLLAQIEINEGNLNAAIASVEKASLIAPNDTGVFFQLGFLKYRDEDYKGAISALERSVILNPVYSNAKYFLGLSYDIVGREDEAIAQFEDILLLNPGNSEVEQILENLKAGRGALENTVEPAPEDREEPPIEE